MCWIKCRISDGLVDHEKVAKFESYNGDTVEVSVFRSLVDEPNGLLKADKIAHQHERVLIELPTESARGDWRAWVKPELVRE